MLRWGRLETSAWNHKLIRKLLSEVINQVRSRFFFLISLHAIGHFETIWQNAALRALLHWLYVLDLYRSSSHILFCRVVKVNMKRHFKFFWYQDKTDSKSFYIESFTCYQGIISLSVFFLFQLLIVSFISTVAKTFFKSYFSKILIKTKNNIPSLTLKQSWKSQMSRSPQRCIPVECICISPRDVGVDVSVCLRGLAREIHNSGAINILIPYNYTGSHTHMHTHALSLSGGILIHFLVITLSIKQTNSERTNGATMRAKGRRGGRWWGVQRG